MSSKRAAIASRACSHYRVETIFTPRTWQSRTYVTYVTWLARLHVRYLLFESAAERKELSPSDFSMVNVWFFWSGDGFLRICRWNIFVTFLVGGMSHETTSGRETQSINRRPESMFLTSLISLHVGFLFFNTCTQKYAKTGHRLILSIQWWLPSESAVGSFPRCLERWHKLCEDILLKKKLHTRYFLGGRPETSFWPGYRSPQKKAHNGHLIFCKGALVMESDVPSEPWRRFFQSWHFERERSNISELTDCHVRWWHI